MSDERIFKIKIKVPKEDDDKKTDDDEIEIKVGKDKVEKGEEFEEDVEGKNSKKYRVKGKAKVGWFGDYIDDLKVFPLENDTEGTELKGSDFRANQWRWKGPITVGSVILLVIVVFVWWWMSSSKDKEEESL